MERVGQRLPACRGTPPHGDRDGRACTDSLHVKGSADKAGLALLNGPGFWCNKVRCSCKVWSKEPMSIIRNHGFMWTRDAVEWGRRGVKAGSIKGFCVNNIEKIAEFNNQIGVYVLYDRFEQPIQVGQTRALINRLRQHRRDHLRNRWHYFSWFGFCSVNNDGSLSRADRRLEIRRNVALIDALSEIEAVLIHVLEPRLNRRGANWGDAEEYLQYPIEISTEEEEEDVSED